jgi:hypothetical protein
MKMNNYAWGMIFLLSITIMLSSVALAETSEMKDTSIDYVAYREVVVKDAGVVYQIKITNTGDSKRLYELAPATDAIKSIGTYRIDPSDIIILQPGEEKIVYFYLSVDKPLSGRAAIPLKITSDKGETTLELVARTIGPFMPAEKKTVPLITIFKIAVIIILVIIIILALILGFKKMRKSKESSESDEKSELEENVETYY